MRCSVCKSMYYCGRECQLADWRRGHKFGECKTYEYERQLASADPDTPDSSNQNNGRKWIRDYDTACLLLRLYLIAHHKPSRLSRRTECPPFDRQRSFDDLMSNRDAVNKHQKRMDIFDQLSAMYERARVPIRRELLFDVFCRMYVNGFSIMTPSLFEIGRAVYVLASMFDHSCVPNAVTVFNGIHIQVRTLRSVDITKEPILISYLNVLVSPQKRVETLTNHYYFTCQCERCAYGENNLKVVDVEKLQLTPDTSDQAEDTTDDWHELKKHKNRKQKKDRKMAPSENDSKLQLKWDPTPSKEKMRQFRDFMNRMSQEDLELSTKHEALDKQLSDHVLNRRWNEALQVGMDMLRNFNNFYINMPNPEVTFHLIQLLQIQRNLLRFEFTLKHKLVCQLWEQLSAAILITHGTQHPLYTNEYADLRQYLIN